MFLFTFYPASSTATILHNPGTAFKIKKLTLVQYC